MSVVLSERIKLVSGLETQYKPKDTNSELFEVSKLSWQLDDPRTNCIPVLTTVHDDINASI